MVNEITSDVLQRFIDSGKSQDPVKICFFLMEISGEVIFRSFFGDKQTKTKDGLLLSQELA